MKIQSHQAASHAQKTTDLTALAKPSNEPAKQPEATSAATASFSPAAKQAAIKGAGKAVVNDAKATANPSQDPKLAASRGTALLQAGRGADALKAFNAALALDPSLSAAITGLAQAESSKH